MQVNSSTENYGFQDNSSKTEKILDKNAFLQLFIAQLKSQDPLSPQDSNSFMQQMAQFSVLEQLTNLSAEIAEMKRFQEISEGSLLLGRQVTVQSGEELVSGQVEKITFNSEGTFIFISGNRYYLGQVTEIR